MGDPDGIGPEIIAKTLKRKRFRLPVMVVGSRDFFPDPVPVDVTFLEVDVNGGDPSFMYVKKAVSLALAGKAGAVVTAPISKEKWLAAGHSFMGHTDYLVKTAEAGRWVMFFWSESMKVALYTAHIPLKDVFEEVKKEKISGFCRFVNSELLRLTGKKYDLLVSGLNPHAGEGGSIGREELEEIGPAVDELKEEMNIAGPFPPDTVFLEAAKMKNPVIVSLYHDQGLIPFKLNYINSGVNMTLGLPFIRTSPDHGTAFDIAGKGIADPGSMIEAVKLAEWLLS